MMQQRLEDSLLGNYNGLHLLLQGKGYGPEASRPKGFALYQIVPPGEAAGQPGTYFAMRQLRKTLRVEKAILWEAGSLEKAVSLLDKLPRQPAQNSRAHSEDYCWPVVFATVCGGLVAGMAMLSGWGTKPAALAGVLAGVSSLAASSYVILAGCSSDARALARKATYCLALRDFRNASVDRAAVAVLTEFLEV